MPDQSECGHVGNSENRPSARLDRKTDPPVAVELPVFDHAFGITVVILQEKILIAASRKPVARLKAQVRVQVPTAAFDDQQREADPLVEALVIDGCLAVASDRKSVV